MINISHGERKEQAKAGFPTKPMAVVKPQAAGQHSGQYGGHDQSYSHGGKNHHHGAVSAGGSRHGRGGSSQVGVHKSGNSLFPDHLP